MKAKVERIVSERDGTMLSHVWLLFTMFVSFVLSCVIYQDLDGVLPRVTIMSLTSQKKHRVAAFKNCWNFSFAPMVQDSS